MSSPDAVVGRGPGQADARTGPRRSASMSAARSRPGRRRAEECSDLLSDVLARLSAATDLESVVGAVAACAPGLADVSHVHIRATSVRGPGASPPVAGTRLHLSAADSVLQTATSQQRTLHRPCVEQPAAEQLRGEIDRPLFGPASSRNPLVVVPVVVDRVPAGELVLVRGAGRPGFDGWDVRTSEQLAVAIGLRLDALRRAARPTGTAGFPRPGPRPTASRSFVGLDVAFQQRSSGRADVVGGDWADAISLAGGRTAFTVGDVMGRGQVAAGPMRLLRSAIQALAPLQLDPGQLLARLDDLAQQYQAAHPEQVNWLATCVYAAYDPVTGECSIASAGHPPPVRTGPDGESVLLDVPPGAPLGVGGADFPTVRTVIPDGGRLTLYTDGLIEVRGQDIEEGMAAICRLTASQVGSTPEQACHELIDQVSPGPDSDDVAVMVTLFHGPAARCPSALPQ
jgi:hypothetical protein